MSKLTLNANVDLILTNADKEEGEMRCFYNFNKNDYVGFVFNYKGKLISLTDEEVDGDEQEYFHL